MATPGARSGLVCDACWTLCFSTTGYRDFCQGHQAEYSYQINKDNASSSSIPGCKWCKLVAQLVERSREEIPEDVQLLSSSHVIRLGTGMFREDFTPKGNNRLYLWVNGVYSYMTAFTDDSNPASSVVTARSVRTDVNSDATFQDIAQWLKECTTHQDCQPPTEVKLPKRVIYVGRENEVNPTHILETSGSCGTYAALSYCWGPSQIGTTIKSNLDPRLRSFNTGELSRSVQDAIQVTRRLGLQYLWVDAICIVQDSDHDKDSEIKVMCDIYRNAYITIVAANSADSRHGFLKVQQIRDNSIEIPFWNACNQLGSVQVKEEGWYNDDSEPINIRAWTLQERLLSPRLLIYSSHTLQFQCQQSFSNLGNSLHVPSGLASWRLPHPITNVHQIVADEDLDGEAAVNTWKQVITLYSSRKLSQNVDKLIALGGLAQAFNFHIHESYLAGLWSGSTLPSLLLWECESGSGVTTYEEYIAPSWSWAASSTSITYRNAHRVQKHIPYHIEILSASTTLKNVTLPFGGVVGGHIVLQVYVKPAIYMLPHHLRWVKPGIQPRRPPYPASGVYGSEFVLPDVDIHANLDSSDASDNTEVLSLALASRTYEVEGIWYKAIDGLLIQSSALSSGLHAYKRVGCFFGAMEEEFGASEMREVMLI